MSSTSCVSLFAYCLIALGEDRLRAACSASNHTDNCEDAPELSNAQRDDNPMQPPTTSPISPCRSQMTTMHAQLLLPQHVPCPASSSLSLPPLPPWAPWQILTCSCPTLPALCLPPTLLSPPGPCTSLHWSSSLPPPPLSPLL